MKKPTRYSRNYQEAYSQKAINLKRIKKTKSLKYSPNNLPGLFTKGNNPLSFLRISKKLKIHKTTKQPTHKKQLI